MEVDLQHGPKEGQRARPWWVATPALPALQEIQQQSEDCEGYAQGWEVVPAGSKLGPEPQEQLHDLSLLSSPCLYLSPRPLFPAPVLSLFAVSASPVSSTRSPSLALSVYFSDTRPSLANVTAWSCLARIAL